MMNLISIIVIPYRPN